MADNDARKRDQNLAKTGEGDRVTDLTWALLDELISEDELAALDGLLRHDGKARNEYLQCVQLHADLRVHFAESAPPAETTSITPPPIIGLPPSGGLQFDVPSPTAEDVQR